MSDKELQEIVEKTLETVSFFANFESTELVEILKVGSAKKAKSGKKVASRKELGIVLAGLGKAWRLKGEYKSAIESLKRALVVQEELKEEEQVIATLIDLTRTSRLIFALDDAYKYIEKVQKLMKEPRADILNELAQIYYAKGDMGNAEDSAKKSIEMAKKEGDEEFLGEATLIMGLLSLKKEDYTSAEKEITESLKLAEKASNKLGMIKSMKALAGYKAEAGINEAQKLLNDALVEAEKSGSLIELWEIYYTLGKIYSYGERKAEMESAYKKAREILDEIGEDYTANSEIQSIYENVKKVTGE